MKKLACSLSALLCAAMMGSAVSADVVYYDYYDNGYGGGVSYGNQTPVYNNYGGYSENGVYYGNYNYSNNTNKTDYYANKGAPTAASSEKSVVYDNPYIYYNSSAAAAVPGKTTTARQNVYTTSAVYYSGYSILPSFPYCTHSTINRRISQYKYYDDYGNYLIFRRAAGNRDVSGVTTRYSKVTSVKMDRSTVKFKGTKDGYYLAIWAKGGYAYSIKSKNALTLTEMEDLVYDVTDGYVF